MVFLWYKNKIGHPDIYVNLHIHGKLEIGANGHLTAKRLSGMILFAPTKVQRSMRSRGVVA
jgi:hypothetical protein